jgi:hypothetical protein
VDIIRWGLYNIDRGKKNNKEISVSTISKNSILQQILSEGKESYPMRGEKTAMFIKNA